MRIKGALTLTRTCPYCGERMNAFDYELTGGHRECLFKRDIEEMLPPNDDKLERKQEQELDDIIYGRVIKILRRRGK